MCGEFIGSWTRKARKRHWCCACPLPIPPGSSYVKSAEKDVNDFMVSKWHTECRAEFDNLLREHGEDCADPWSTWEHGRPPNEIAARYFIGPLEAE